MLPLVPVGVVVGVVEGVEDGAGGAEHGLRGVADLLGVPVGPPGDVAEAGAAGVEAPGAGDDVYVDSVEAVNTLLVRRGV